MDEYNNQEAVEETVEIPDKKEGGSGSMIGSIIVIIVIIIGGLYFWGSKNTNEEIAPEIAPEEIPVITDEGGEVAPEVLIDTPAEAPETVVPVEPVEVVGEESTTE